MILYIKNSIRKYKILNLVYGKIKIPDRNLVVLTKHYRRG